MFERVCIEDRSSPQSLSIEKTMTTYSALRCLFAVSCCAVLLAACESPNSTPKPEATPEAPVAKQTAKPVVAKEAPVVKDTPAEAAPDAQPGVLGVGSTPVDIKPGASHTYGSQPTIIEPPIALAAAIEKAKTSEGPYKVEAVVDKVCQKAGCWFTLNADGVTIPIRVKMKNYAFFVPKNAMGSKAVLEGTFKKTQITQETAQHYADDAAEGTGKPAEKIKGPQDTYMFMASSVYLTKPS